MRELVAPQQLYQLAGSLLHRRRETISTDHRIPAPTDMIGLFERLQKSDHTALEPFIEATQAMAARLALNILQNQHSCQDVLQDCYLAVFQKAGQVREARAWKSWFCQIVVNRCRQELRGRRTDPIDDLPESSLPIQSDPTSRVDNQLDVRQALSQLPAHDQAVLTMREVMDLSYDEIAQNLEISPGTVRSRLFYARRRLLALLSPNDRRAK